MANFDELVASRKEWIENVLKPWSVSAPRLELMKASLEWVDIAGKVSPESTLWTWAWSRFPDLTCEGLEGVNETSEVKVVMKNGSEYIGFPDNQKSDNGSLVLYQTNVEPNEDSPPLSIDEIDSVSKLF